MANQRDSNQKRTARKPAASGSRTPRKPAASGNRTARNAARSGSPARRRQTRKVSRGLDLSKLYRFRKDVEFKPDSQDSGILKTLHLTQVQRGRLLKWGLYIALIAGLLMVQDVIMSQITLFGATTDLAVCIILLITVIEGVEVGSLFVLLASLFYYFAGTSPGPYCVALLTFLGIGACLFRQLFWHRNRGSIVLCAGLALMLYEIGVFAFGVFSELTRWDRFQYFVTTGLLSVAVMIPLYSLINAIGQIGGNTWKE